MNKAHADQCGLCHRAPSQRTITLGLFRFSWPKGLSLNIPRFQTMQISDPKQFYSQPITQLKKLLDQGTGKKYARCNGYHIL